MCAPSPRGGDEAGGCEQPECGDVLSAVLTGECGPPGVSHPAALSACVGVRERGLGASSPLSLGSVELSGRLPGKDISHVGSSSTLGDVRWIVWPSSHRRWRWRRRRRLLLASLGRLLQPSAVRPAAALVYAAATPALFCCVSWLVSRVASGPPHAMVLASGSAVARGCVDVAPPP
jgi:hypothetical protein